MARHFFFGGTLIVRRSHCDKPFDSRRNSREFAGDAEAAMDAIMAGMIPAI